MDADMSAIITVSREELQHNRWIPHEKHGPATFFSSYGVMSPSRGKREPHMCKIANSLHPVFCKLIHLRNFAEPRPFQKTLD